MNAEYDDQDGLRARSEQAIGELAQVLLDSNVLENAVAAAFGAREKALEAQQAAMSALNLPSAGDVERLERRLRSLSQRLEEVEDQIDRLSRDLGDIRRQSAAEKARRSRRLTLDLRLRVWPGRPARPASRPLQGPPSKNGCRAAFSATISKAAASMSERASAGQQRRGLHVGGERRRPAAIARSGGRRSWRR